MKKMRNELFLQFARSANRTGFKLTHDMYIYMFDEVLMEDKKEKAMHIVLGKGYVYDYHKKHSCVSGVHFWEAMNVRFGKSELSSIIKSGDIIYVKNYIYKETDQKVTYFVLTDVFGKIKSTVFFDIESMYDAIKEMDPENNGGIA